MSIIGVGETLVTAAVPQVAVARFGARAILYLVAAVLAAGLLWFVGDRLFFAPARHKAEVAQLATTVKASAAVTETAKDATATGTEIQIVRDRIERITRENTVRIMAAPGASAAVTPEFDAAWLAAVCVRDANQHDPACDAVPRSAAGNGDGADAGRADPAG